MEIFSAYNLIIASSLILIMSFFFGEASRKTSIPSVLLLIILGIFIKLGLNYFSLGDLDFFPILEVLGIIGLIMIVLEAALELKLEREKYPLIGKALLIALLGLVLSTWLTAEVLKFFIDGMDNLTAWIYATPLSVLSSAIVIPSVVDLRMDKKEFHIYESTFSDILGIMMFYFLTSQIGVHGADGHGGSVLDFGLTTLLTIFLSLFFSYLIVIVFQNIRSNVKLFLLIAVLLLLYSLGKKMHLSSLIIILVFGLVIANIKVFFRGPLSRFLDYGKATGIYNGLHEITMETSFVVRTFFFVIFGITITFEALADWNVLAVSALLLLIIYVVRFLLLRLYIGKDIIPQLYIAPRGLITILLFYNIPAEVQVAGFSQGILLYLILGTSVVMTFSMIYDKRRSNTAINELKSKPIGRSKWTAPGLD